MMTQSGPFVLPELLTPWVAMPDHLDTDGWYLVNVQQYGYYRVNYDQHNWNALINQLKKKHQVFWTVLSMV